MLKEENAELIIDGKRVENDYTFVADEEEMKVENFLYIQCVCFRWQEPCYL